MALFLKAIIMTVCPSVHHTREPELNDSRYLNMFTLYDKAVFLVS